MGKASPTLMCAQVREALRLLSLVLTVASLVSAEATPALAPTKEAFVFENLSVTFIDGVAALILGIVWACRTYVLNQSYSSSKAPYWASQRRLACWLVVIAVLGALAALLIGCVAGSARPSPMNSVVAVVVGAFVTVALEKRSQGPPSAKLWTLQELLQRRFYRAGKVGLYGHGDRRTALFEENDNPPSKSSNHQTWEKTTWRNTAIQSGNTWTYFVKPGSINDHCYLGRYEVLENAAGGNDPILFAAAYASVTAAYLARLNLSGLQKKIVQLLVVGPSIQNLTTTSKTSNKRDVNSTNRVLEVENFANNASEEVGSSTNTTSHAAKTWARRRVKNSLQSWRPRALARHLLGKEDVLSFEVKSDRRDQQVDTIVDKLIADKLSADELIILWAVCWHEEREYLKCAMGVIAAHLKNVHADGRAWEYNVEEEILKKEVEQADLLVNRKP